MEPVETSGEFVSFDTFATESNKKVFTFTENEQTLCPHLQRSTFCGTRAPAMVPDRKWCHDSMRHARHGDASQKHSPRHEYAKKVRATGVNNTAHEKDMCE